ncbi:MAG TPA: DNA translocase FtsK 4TM domain-containing protein, partial [Candidatus Sulfotelmatobacter sp.]|nr:DNA translocase FtsK 4TM domain-containing protein [Candidatus Sulfotelmatobacter sp.]
MSLQQQKGWHKAVRELTALGLWALAVYIVLSLVTYDAGWEHNLGGVVGGALARILEHAFGHVSYVVVLFLVWLGWSVGAGASIRMLGRYTTGGMILLLALSATLGNFPALSSNNVASSSIAGALPTYVNFSEFSVVVLIGIITALALLGRRPPPATKASSNAALIHRRFGSGPEPNDTLPWREMLEIGQVPRPGDARSTAWTPTHAPEAPPIVL